MQSREIIVKNLDKPSAPWDYGSRLQFIWSEDKDRNWLVYARNESYRPFWDTDTREAYAR